MPGAAPARRPDHRRARRGERFQKEYISLFALARQRGKHFRAVKKALEADGVEPAFDPKKIGATFYRRSECRRRPMSS